jgi:glycosyltransferase involved in cell wall biosynthesis
MKPRLAFVSLCDATDQNASSGYPFSIRRQLQKRFNVVDLFPLPLGLDWRWLPIRAAYKLVGRGYHSEREPAALKTLARRVERGLAAIKPDVVFAPSSLPMCFVDTTCPTAFVTDQVFCDFVHGYVHRPSKRFLRVGNAQEALALARATLVSYPSQWAAQSAERHYATDPRKLAVIPWGANLPFEIEQSEVAAAIARRPFDSCHLVFVGKDWERKGGDTFVDIVRQMNRLGLKTRGTVIGANPEGLPTDVFTIHPYLDKARPDHFALFASIMLDAHFLILPTRAEAFPHVLCEATAFGVPAISSPVGGITEIIHEGDTGFVRPLETSAEQLALLIRDTLATPANYVRLARQSREAYEQRLNWDNFGKRINESIAALV